MLYASAVDTACVVITRGEWGESSERVFGAQVQMQWNVPPPQKFVEIGFCYWLLQQTIPDSLLWSLENIFGDFQRCLVRFNPFCLFHI